MYNFIIIQKNYEDYKYKTPKIETLIIFEPKTFTVLILFE